MPLSFLQVVVDAIDPSCLVSSPLHYPIDLTTATQEQLQHIHVPLRFQIGALQAQALHRSLLRVHVCGEL